MENFGSYLKTQREKKGIRLEEIASITKIHLHSLNLLEANRWKELPPEPFIRGFILAYAKYIGLDAKDVLARYTDEVSIATHPSGEEELDSQSSAEKPSAHPSPPSEIIAHAEPAFSRRILMGLGALGAASLFAVIIYIGKTATTKLEPGEALLAESTPSSSGLSDQGTPAAKKPPPEAPLAAAPVAANPSTSAKVELAPSKISENSLPTPPPAGTRGHQVTIEGKERTWVKVVVDDAAPVEYFLPKGELAQYEAKKKIKVVLGNSTGAVVTHNGESASGLKFQGTVRSYVFPKDARFPQDVPKRTTAATRSEEQGTESVQDAPTADSDSSSDVEN